MTCLCQRGVEKLLQYVQNGRFGAGRRLVHKAEDAITCHHIQLGALLKSAAGALYFKETGNVCDMKCEQLKDT